jgi:hypothetical protein
VNLAEQHGKEGVVTNAYREYAEEAQLSDVKYVSCVVTPSALTVRKILSI